MHWIAYRTDALLGLARRNGSSLDVDHVHRSGHQSVYLVQTYLQ